MSSRIYQTELPRHSLEEALRVPEAIWNQYAGDPTPPHDVATAVGLSPTGSTWRTLSGAAAGYGLTEGSYNAEKIRLLELGESAVAPTAGGESKRALKRAALTPSVLKKFFEKYDRKNLPRDEIMRNVLQKEMGVPADKLDVAVEVIRANGHFVGFIKDTPGQSDFVAIDMDRTEDPPSEEDDGAGEPSVESEAGDPTTAPQPSSGDGTEPERDAAREQRVRPIFIGHGKNKEPVDRLTKFLRQFGVPHRVVTEEAHAGRPISTKVRDAMADCGSAIIVFTKDEKFLDEDGNEVWRPSENTVHELGAALYAFGQKVVIFKEKGIELPANYAGIGHIPFEADNVKATESDLLRELVELDLLRVSPTASQAD